MFEISRDECTCGPIAVLMAMLYENYCSIVALCGGKTLLGFNNSLATNMQTTKNFRLQIFKKC